MFVQNIEYQDSSAGLPKNISATSVPIVGGITLPLHDDSSVGESVGNSIDWCDGSVGSLVSIADSDYSSVTSNFSSDDMNDMMFDDEDLNPIQNLAHVKIETTLLKCFSEVREQLGQREEFVGAPVTVSTVSTAGLPLGADHDMDSDIDQICDSLAVLTKLKPPYSSIPDEVVCEIFSYLNVNSLLVVRQVSKRFKSLGSRDQAGWSSHCAKLWSDKAHVSWRATQLRDELGALSAYRTSCEDGLSCQEITPNELCFDPVSGKGTIWHFRFKQSAGSAWTSFDPWHAGLDARRMVFFRDGTVRELVLNSGSGDSFRVEHPFFDAPNQQGEPNNQHRSPPIEMKWRFLLEPMDMPARPRGAYVRLTVGGRDVPTYIVRRSPTGNWGFVVENCWGIFASFPLPRRQDTARVVPHRPMRMRLRRTSAGGVRWLNVEGLESDSEEEDMELDGQGLTNDEVLLGDRALPTTSRRQWREALLYNYGAVSLPEGGAAQDEFDRIFDTFRSPIQSLDMVR
jgi:hypothetical protein